MKPGRVSALLVVLGCLAVGVLAPAAGCTGTGTTPICNFPDGANNPEAGCGVLIEGSAGEAGVTVDAPASIDAAVDTGADRSDGGSTMDATAPVDVTAADVVTDVMTPDDAGPHVDDAAPTG